MKSLVKFRAYALTALAALCAACSSEAPQGQSGNPGGGGQIAKEKIGTLAATIDGVAYRGEMLNVPSEGTSTAEFMAFGPMTTVSIQAHDPLADAILDNVFSIDITLTGNDASAGIADASVSYFPEGMSAPFFVNEDNEAETEVTLETLSFETGAASVTGRFKAKLCRKASMFSEADTADCIDTAGTFETALSESA